MNLGKAMDTLRKDMPYILKRAPGMFLYIAIAMFMFSGSNGACLSLCQIMTFTTTISLLLIHLEFN